MPAGNAIDFVLTGSYTPPAGDAIDFTITDLAPPIDLVVASASHSHEASVGAVIIPIEYELEVQDASQGMITYPVRFIQNHVIVGDDVIHSQLATGDLKLKLNITLTVNDVSHAHTSSTNVAAYQVVVLAVQNALQAHLTDNLELDRSHLLEIQDAIQAQLASEGAAAWIRGPITVGISLSKPNCSISISIPDEEIT